MEGGGKERISSYSHWRWLRWVLCVILLLLIAVGAILLAVRLLHPRLVYTPKSYKDIPEGSLLAEMPQVLSIDPFTLTSPDGTKFRAYWCRHYSTRSSDDAASPPSSNRHLSSLPSKRSSLPSNTAPSSPSSSRLLPSLLYLHGSEGDLDAAFKRIAGWQRVIKINILFISYRGFGYSEGDARQKGIEQDSQTALDHLIKRPDVDPTRLLLYGHSLGGAVALHLLENNWSIFRAVIIENTFLSISKMISHAYPMLVWARFLLTELWDNEAKVDVLEMVAQHSRLVRLPNLLLISGEKDTVVPPFHMQELWRRIRAIGPHRPNAMIQLASFPKCHHACSSEPDYYHRLETFFNRLFNSARL